MRCSARRGLAVGFFDGVHLGHQSVLRRAAAALTFRTHPLSLLAPNRAPRLLMSPESRIAAIKNCGVGKVVGLDFTCDLARMSAKEFMLRYLDRKTCDGVVYCGENWRFGRGGEGDARLLRSYGIDVEVIPYAEHLGDRISSTRIRAALEAGEIKDATAMLGRPWTVDGVAFQGKGEGTALGFPTINIRFKGLELQLRRGVYAVEAAGRRGIANYGVAPTFGDRAWKDPILEVHFLDGMPCTQPESDWTVSFLGFLRPETVFPSLGDLRRQINADIAALRQGHV